jgi:hypothetical protein
MNFTIPQIAIQERGRLFTDQDYVYTNLFFSQVYGSLHLKHSDFNERHIFMNHLLSEIYTTYTLTMNGLSEIESHHFANGHYKVLFLTETFIYWIRKNIDEMIGLNYYAYHFTKYKTEPAKLKIASIGNLINKKDHALYTTFFAHIDKLNRINEISNTFKHSFVNSEAHNLFGKREPVVNCLDLHRNNAVKGPVWHSYYLREIVEDYDTFFVSSRQSLKKFQGPWLNTDSHHGDQITQT